MSGWIKLHRQLMESDLWMSEPFDRGKAWVDMIMLANHKPGYIRSNGMKIAVARGQLGWSEIRLSERWNWSRGKVRRFLSELEGEQMIEQQKDRRKSLVTICNYNEFQGDGKGNDTTDSTTDGQETDKKRYTNKNDKKEKKSNGAPAFDFSKWPAEPSAVVFKDFKSQRKKPLTQTAINRMSKTMYELNDRSVCVDDVLSICCERGWESAQTDWVLKHLARDGTAAPKQYEALVR